MIVYINQKTTQGVETLYEINSNDYKTLRDFRKSIREDIENYAEAGEFVYSSSRCTKDYKERL